MKRMFSLLLLLFGIYFMIQIGFNLYGQGHESNYVIQNDKIRYEINEIFKTNQKNEHDNYFFNISFKNKTISFKTYKNFSNNSVIIKNVYSYIDDKYTCILPIFKGNQIIVDIMCSDNNQLYFYNSLKGKNIELDAFAKKLENEAKYEPNKWTNSLDKATTKSGITVYKSNIVKNYNIAVNSYKGVSIIDPRRENLLNSINVFRRDVNNKKISGYVKDYYVIANYEQPTIFKYIYIVNLKTFKVTNLKMPEDATYNTYVMGSHENSLYLYDRIKKRQYKVDTKEQKVTIPDEEHIFVYQNGIEKIENIPNNDVYFEYYKSDYNEDGYYRIDKVGNESGYYYFYKKINNNYQVYRSNAVDPSYKTYLFTATNMNQISYVNDYIYFVSNDSLMSYNDEFGLKTNIIYSEFKNNAASYSVFKQ